MQKTDLSSGIKCSYKNSKRFQNHARRGVINRGQFGIRKTIVFGSITILLLGLLSLNSAYAATPTDNFLDNGADETSLHDYSLIILGDSTITHVQIFLKQEIAQPKVSVAPLGEKSPGGVNAPSDAKSFFEITTNVEDNYEIVRSKIGFKVSKTWLKKNEIQENSIKLMRLNGDWHELPTELKDETGTFLYFESESPGFSIFALSAKGNPPEEPPYLLYTAMGIGMIGTGISIFYWFKNRRIKPSIPLEIIKEVVFGGEKSGPEKKLGESKTGINLKPKPVREKTRRERAEIVESLRKSVKEED